MEEKSKLKIEIKFGNLIPESKSNIYIATQERAVENKRYYGYKGENNYVVVYDEDIPVPNAKRYINLKHFETYEIKEV